MSLDSSQMTTYPTNAAKGPIIMAKGVTDNDITTAITLMTFPHPIMSIGRSVKHSAMCNIIKKVSIILAF